MIAILIYSILSMFWIYIQTMNLLFAGHDTTTNLITWVFYYLSENPKVADTLYAEINETLGGQPLVNIEQLKKMKYLKAVIQVNRKDISIPTQIYRI